MRISLKYALWLLAALPLIQGCDDKKHAQAPAPQVLAPPIEDTPPPKPATVSTADLPPPVLGNVPSATPPATTSKPPEPPKKVPHKRKPVAPSPSSTSTSAQDLAKVEQPAAPAPSPSTTSGVSAIGTLSGGSSGSSKSETEDSINATERGVNGITRTLSDSESKTAAQIREFIKQAREALTTGDVDGAHTLAVKAKVLLTELNQ